MFGGYSNDYLPSKCTHATLHSITPTHHTFTYSLTHTHTHAHTHTHMHTHTHTHTHTHSSKLHHNAAAVQVPIGLEGRHEGVVDIIRSKAYYFQGDQG